MYKTRKRIVLVGMNIFSILFFVGITLFLLPEKTTASHSTVSFVVTVMVFLIAIFWGNRMRMTLMNKVRKDTLESGETVIINEFIDKLRFCYSLDDFYLVIGDVLEKKGDCSVLFVDRYKNYILYNSPNRTSTSDSVRTKLDQNFTDSWQDGFYFFDHHIGVTSKYKKARGFFMCFEGQHLYVFCPCDASFRME